MSDRMKDGGPAFPNLGDNTDGNRTYDGMSLRDRFVEKILPVLVRLSVTGEVDDYTPEAVAFSAYSFADAAIAEREKREGGKNETRM